MSKSAQAYGGKIKNPLDSIFGEIAAPAKEATATLDQITLPQTQPRRYFDPQAQEQLVASIRQHGILQPLLVRPRADGNYELVAGERRYRAAVELSLETVPIVERELTDNEAFQLALIENLQRENLNPVEETEGILHLLALQLNVSIQDTPPLLYRLKHLSERESDDSGHNVMPNSELGKVETLFDQLGLMTWQSFVKNRLPLLNLPEDVLETIRKGQIAYTKAKEIARIKVVQTRKKVLKRAIAEEWSLNQIRDHLKTLQTNSEQPSQSPLKQQFDAVYRKAKKVKIWENPDSQKRLQELLTEIETLLAKVEA